MLCCGAIPPWTSVMFHSPSDVLHNRADDERDEEAPETLVRPGGQWRIDGRSRGTLATILYYIVVILNAYPVQIRLRESPCRSVYRSLAKRAECSKLSPSSTTLLLLETKIGHRCTRPLRVEPAVYTIAITLKFCQIGSVLLQACRDCR